VKIFELAEGERELLAERLTGSREGKQVANSRLVVTDRRLALLVPKPGGWTKIFRVLFGRMAEAAVERAGASSALELVAQIKRSDFDVVEQDGSMIVFRNKGSGYAHVSFEIYDGSPFAIWQDRMRAWIAGDYEAMAKVGFTPDPELPEARAARRRQ
jgi:hypothetical protein